jgi:3-methyladenine DNA glycosylase AlkD
MLTNLIKELQDARDPKQAEGLQRFFKTGIGEYGEGDKFLGIKVPIQRQIAKKYTGLNLINIQKLLDSKVHEHRLVGLLILIDKFKKSSESERGDIFNFYLKNSKNINNWDLVDLTAHHIVGGFLEDKKKDKLYELAQSKILWEKRIAIISTFAYIKKSEFKDSLRIAEILINDTHDLIHKAVGWMLREIGNRDIKIEEEFLKRYYKNMPRTMLRYAIEKFPEEIRKKYLKGEI